jgi:hypothetical protein
MSSSNQVSWRYIREVTAGTTPGTPTMKEVLRTGGSLMGKTDTVKSNAVRSDRMTQGLFRVGQHAEGSLEVELAYGQFDDLLESMFCSTWTTAVAISGTDISAATSDDSINTAGAVDFVAGGVQAGMWILVAGFATAANNGLFQVSAVTTSKLTFTAKVTLSTGLYGASPNLTDESAGPTVTIKSAGMLRNGTTGHAESWEQAHADVSQYFQFRGMRVNDFDLTINAKALVTAKFGLLGMSFDRTGSTIATAVTAPNSNLAFNTTENIIGVAEGGAALSEAVQSITLSSKNNLAMIDAVSHLNPVDLSYGSMDLSGEIKLYLASTSGTLLDKYIDFTESSQSFVLTNGTSALYYILTIPAYRFSGDLPDAGKLNDQVIASLPFTAYKSSGGFQVQLDRIAA